MKHFLQDKRGSAVVWTAFLILIFFTLAFVVYTGVTVYAKYQACETELERAALVMVDRSMVNPNVRDLLLDIPAASAQALLEENLTETGWAKEDAIWVKCDGGKLIYNLEAIQIKVDGKALQIDATFVMPMPWAVSGMDEIRIPMTVLSSVLYIK
jgi:hypothetical protein